MEGKLLAPLGIAFIVALFASLIIAITLTPVLCSYMLTNEKRLEKQEKESWLVTKLQLYYVNFLEFAMRWKKAFIGSALAMLFVAILAFTQLGRSFLPEFNEGALTIAAVSLPGLSLDESNKIGKRVEDALLSVPEVISTTRRTGRAELDEHAQGVNSSEIEIPFELGERSRAEFLAEIRENFFRQRSQHHHRSAHFT
jgi:Cu/Ag efflux pump CusA